MNVAIRPYNHDQDCPFIYSTWPKGAYFGSYHFIRGNKQAWFTAYYHYVSRHLKYSDVKIACLEADPFTIVGYMIINGDNLVWIYVKEDFRRSGVAKLLTKNHTIKEVSNLTKTGKYIADKHDLKEKPINDAFYRQKIKEIRREHSEDTGAN